MFFLMRVVCLHLKHSISVTNSSEFESIDRPLKHLVIRLLHTGQGLKCPSVNRMAIIVPKVTQFTTKRIFKKLNIVSIVSPQGAV